MEIKNSYLMWVGSEHYKTIDEWVQEATAQGVSKRLPSAETAKAMLGEGTVIFVAHDEGHFHECPDCIGDTECPDCRKRYVERSKMKSEIEQLEKATNDDNAKKKAERRKDKIKQLTSDIKACALCKGMMVARLGTGGHVNLFIDGTQHRWDYRRYNYWLHQPNKFQVSDPDKHMCETCGGTGRLPDAQIFGVFIPDAIEYIMRKEDAEKVKEEMEKKQFRTVDSQVVLTEKKRLCGKRKPGGVYVVTDVKQAPSKTAKEVAKQLADSGAINPNYEIHGNFIQFLDTVEVEAKRFRGIKRWSLDPRAEEEAEMILDALG